MLAKQQLIISTGPVIDPGIYYDLSNEEYHNSVALSSSGIKLLLQDPLLYWDAYINPDRIKKDSKTLKNSRAWHTMLLEPHKFDEEFTIKPNVNSSTVAGMVGEGDYVKMIRGTHILREDKYISSFLQDGHPEVSIFWIDQETGIMCRVRFDWLRPMVGFDYKTIADLNDIGWNIFNFRYDMSAAMYLEGLKQANLYCEGHLGFLLLFGEKESPFLYKTIVLSNDIIEIGHKDFRRGLNIFKECTEKYGTNRWDDDNRGMTTDITVDDMPYQYKQLALRSF